MGDSEKAKPPRGGDAKSWICIADRQTAEAIQLYLAGNQGESMANESVQAVRDIVANSPPPPGLTVYVTGPADYTIIVACAGVFSWLLTVNQVPAALVAWIQQLGVSPWSFLLVVNVLLLNLALDERAPRRR